MDEEEGGTSVEVELGLHFVVHCRSGRCNIDARVAGGARG